VRKTEWLAWVDVLEDDRDGDGPRIRMYVTHGIPFLQLTPFRSAGARYASCGAARTIAAIAAGLVSRCGAEQAPPRLAHTRRGRPGTSAPPTSGLG
jgi:hypothetical protein